MSELRTHRATGTHEVSLVTGQKVQHIECSCGWCGEVHIWAEHIAAESGVA